MKVRYNQPKPATTVEIKKVSNWQIPEEFNSRGTTKRLSDIRWGVTFKGLIVLNGHTPLFMDEFGWDCASLPILLRTVRGVKTWWGETEILCSTPEDDLVYYYKTVGGDERMNIIYNNDKPTKKPMPVKEIRLGTVFSGTMPGGPSGVFMKASDRLVGMGISTTWCLPLDDLYGHGSKFGVHHITNYKELDVELLVKN